MRLASVANAMLSEASTALCDAAGCERLRAIYERTLDELSTLLSDDLQVELSYLSVVFEDQSPSPSELRVAQAEFVGWLEGLLNGIAASVRSQEIGRGSRERPARIPAGTDPDCGVRHPGSNPQELPVVDQLGEPTPRSGCVVAHGRRRAGVRR